MQEEPELCEQLNKNADYMRQGFQQLGFDTGNSETPVIPIVIGNDELTFITWKLLFDNGVFVNPIISPAVAPGRQMLRTSYMATHTEDHLNQVLETFEVVGKQIGLIQ